MNIAFLSYHSGTVSRGVETFVDKFSNILTHLGHKITVFQGSPNQKKSIYKTVVIEAGNIKEFTKKTLSQISLDTEIIFPTNGRWQSLLCKIWSIRNKKKMVISGQSGPGIDDRINLWTFPDAFVVLTEFQENWARRANPFVKISKIPNGVNLEKFNSQVKKINISLPKPIILCVAALYPEKRNDLIIKAVSKMEKGSLLLVGKGPEEENYKKLASELLPGRFEIISQPHDQMPSVYQSADLFTFATVPWESFGIVLIEAMASDLPVVATDDPIRREIVGPAGVFVDVTDTDAYAKSLEDALSKNWQNIPRHQAEKFSWDKISSEYEKLFKSL